MLEEYGKRLPLQPVMTHNDIARVIKNGAQHAESVLQELLQGVSDAVRRASLRVSTIRVGNHVEQQGGAITKTVDVDVEALQSLSRSTKKMMEEDVWITWAAFQAVDTDLKVEQSVRFILSSRFYLPFLGALLPARVFTNRLFIVNRGLAKIWNASENLEKAIISSKYLHGQKLRALTENPGTTTIFLLLLKMLHAVAPLFFTLTPQEGGSSSHNPFLICLYDWNLCCRPRLPILSPATILRLMTTSPAFSETRWERQ